MNKLYEKKPHKLQSGDKIFSVQDLLNSYLPQNNNQEVTVPYAPEEDYEKPLEKEPVTKQQDQQNLESSTGNTFDSQLNKNNNFIAGISSLIRPGLAATSAIANLNYLRKTRDAAKNIVSPRVDAATMSNRPVQGLSPEIIALYLKNLGSMQVKKTSDATSNRIGEQLLNMNKVSAMDKIAGEQAKMLMQERERHDKVAMLNAQEAVKARNEQSEYDADLVNKKAMIDAEYYGKKQDFTNRWIEEAIVKPMEKRIAYNMAKEAIDYTENRNAKQAMVTNAQNAYNQDKSETNKIRLELALKDLYEMQNSSMPYYGQSASYLFPRRNKNNK